jgi:hypothetical protein
MKLQNFSQCDEHLVLAVWQKAYEMHFQTCEMEDIEI